MSEGACVRMLDRMFGKEERLYYNLKGDKFSKNSGKPDRVTMDRDGLFVGLEAKASDGHAWPNQLRNGVWIIQSGGRYIVAYPDFEIEAMDDRTLPQYEYTDEDMRPPKHSYELIIKGVSECQK